MLECGLAERAGRQDDDPRIGRRRRGDCDQSGPQGPEERRQPVNLGVAVQAREDPGDHHPVLQRVAGSRRRLGPVGQRPAPALGVAGQVDGVGHQLLRAGDADLVARAQEAGVAVDQLGGQEPSPQQVARPVQVGQDQVEQLGPLYRPPLDTGPLAARKQHRYGVQVPSPGPSGRGARRRCR